MLYEPYEYEEKDLFKRALEIALLCFRASKSLHNLDDPWMAGELRSSAIALCAAVADGLRVGRGAPEAGRERFCEARAQIARIESLWLVGASLGQLEQDALHLFRERLVAPLSILSRRLSGEDAPPASEAG